MAMLYAARGAHVICYPAAFNMNTGPLHWELLQKASGFSEFRAVDNQIFVVACSPARDTSASYVNWGHSTIVGPSEFWKRLLRASPPCKGQLPCQHSPILEPVSNRSTGIAGISTAQGKERDQNILDMYIGRSCNGTVWAITDHEEASIFADIDYSELDKRRLNMPLESQRRGDLYRLTDVTRMELFQKNAICAYKNVSLCTCSQTSSLGAFGVPVSSTLLLSLTIQVLKATFIF